MLLYSTFNWYFIYFQILQVDRQIDGHYPSVIFLLFVIHYLQQTTPPILPVLHKMVPVPERPAHADNEDVDEKDLANWIIKVGVVYWKLGVVC